MKFVKTKLEGVYVIEPELVEDERGFFARTFCKREFAEQEIDFTIVQTNRSFTKQKGSIRGMHFQREPKAEDKVVQCLQGKIYDVTVDLRKNSKTYGEWVAEELSEENHKMLLIPKGCAHGFQTLEDNCETLYYMSEFYSPEHAAGVLWNDKSFNIQWPMGNPILSKKDSSWPLL